MKSLLTICALTFGVLAVSSAQQPKTAANELPPGPLIRKLPADTRCTITVKNLESSQTSDQPANALIKRITMINSSKFSLLEMADLQSHLKTQTWTVGAYRVVLDPSDEFPRVSMLGSNGPDLTGAAGNDPTARATPPDYPGMESVSARNFTGIAVVGGRRCLTFSDSESEAAAYVDLETRLPVSARSIDSGYTYQFSAASADSMSVPAEVLKTIAMTKARLERLSVRSAR